MLSKKKKGPPAAIIRTFEKVATAGERTQEPSQRLSEVQGDPWNVFSVRRDAAPAGDTQSM